MLKGTTTIELTDVHTGTVETHTEENMVTNALKEIFRPLGLVKDPALYYNTFAPYYQTMLGGILAFDCRIDENPDQFFAPPEANLVACGVYDDQNNTTGTLRGGYNQTESELNIENRYMKYVYDFSTTQGNGTINSVCLTHASGGYTSYGGKDAVQSSISLSIIVDDNTLKYVHTGYTGGTTGDKTMLPTLGVTELLFLIDREEDVAYYVKVNTLSELVIVKRKAYLRSVSVLENPYTEKPIVEEITIPLDTALTAITRFTYNFDTEDKCLYLFAFSTTGSLAANAVGVVKSGDTFQVVKIPIDTWVAEVYTAINTTEVGISFGSSSYGYQMLFGYQNKIIAKSATAPYNLYCFELGNWANVTKISGTDDYLAISYLMFAGNGRLYHGKNGFDANVVNLETLESMPIEPLYPLSGTHGSVLSATPLLNEPLFLYASGGSNSTTSSFQLLGNYLATINNLSEPVTKTADKTMKITYIVQEVDD